MTCCQLKFQIEIKIKENKNDGIKIKGNKEELRNQMELFD